jgi:hypothetical protein
MRKTCINFAVLSAALIAAVSLAGSPNTTKPSVVRLVKTDEGFQLLRNGKPYFIKGAGGDGSRQVLVKAGGNSIRTWGTDKLGPVLAEAHRLGLSVAVGIWLGHERHGFNYNDADQVAQQYQKARDIILRYKDHPAVLLWGLGNEMEGYEKGDNAAIWSAVNNIAALAKKLDPNHPTMTVLAEMGGERVKNVHRLCPDIDIVGINSYGGAASIPGRYKKAGGTRPYILTEFGPPGVWEIKKNGWGAAPELTSTEKAKVYRNVYQRAVASAKGACLGSYVFAWGHKQEATATWFGMFLPDGSRLAAVDVMTEMWSGQPPANRCPTIQSLTIEGPDQVEPGARVSAKLEASDPEGDPLKVRWVLSREASIYGVGGDEEERPPVFPKAIAESDNQHAVVQMPKDGGGYRLFAYVHDNHGGAAVANVPLRVKGPEPLPAARVARLPLIVYSEADQKMPYLPTGWMGNVKAMKMDPNCTVQPHGGKTCIRVEYQAADGWAGVVWQHPANDWGDRPGGWNLTGARRLSFWARGDKGGEVVTFEFGLIGRDKRFHDSARGKLENVKLTSEWRQYRFDLKNLDLSRIKTGFAWVVTGKAGGATVFYVDDVVYD